MKKQLVILLGIFIWICFPVIADTDGQADENTENLLAHVIKGSSKMYFTPRMPVNGMILTVSLPDGTVFSRSFSGSQTPEFSLKPPIKDGSYTYELKLISSTGKNRTRGSEINSAGLDPHFIGMHKPKLQTGHFTVKDGSIITDNPGENLSTPQDVLHYDDVIITGSLCVGFDCQDGESFGFDTQIFKEHNLRLYFNDTSYTASYPSNSWRITINDSTNGGASYFSIDDVDDGTSIFKIEAGAPSNSLYVEDYGRVGLGTSTPVVELHIKDSDTPTLRLEQDSSGGWTAQTWDVAGNESNFFIRDATNGSKLPFRIQPSTPSSTLCLKSDGKVGIGTWSPEYSLEVETTGEHAMFVLQRTDGAEFKLSSLSNKVQIGARSNHEVRFTTNNLARMTISAAGNVGIDNTAPGHKLVVGTSGAYCDGGAWVDGSSRTFKENIRALSETDALNALDELKPVRYNYKTNRSEEYLGFIAEDVPELVAMKDRRGMTAMDVVAVLTRVVQNQNRKIRSLEKSVRENRNLAKLVKELQKKISNLEK